MSVRAKVRVESNEQTGDTHRVIARPVYDSDPNSENGRFFKYTPSGLIDLGIMNEAAAAQFEVGAEYYVDFTKVEKAE